MCEPTNQSAASVETLDIEGDVIIVAHGNSPDKTRRFLVSTKVLGLASPVFLKLLGPKFLQGQQLANSYRPEIALYEDDPAILGVIFSVLHYREPEEMSEMSSQWLATFAIHCDKYDCTKALWPRIHVWLGKFKKKILTPKDHGNLLLAAYLFRNSQQFTALSREAQLKLPITFSPEWEESEILNRLPNSVILQLSEHIENLLDSMEYEVHSVEMSLRAHEALHATQAKECEWCGRTHPAVDQMCKSCHECTLRPKFCTSDYRISQYFFALQKAHLQPDCATGEICPLKKEVEKLVRNIYALLKQAAGLSLSDIQTL